MTESTDDWTERLQRPSALWTRSQVLDRPTPVPAVPGIYGWHFLTPPAEGLDANRLLYVGIAPRHMRTRSSTQTLRQRIRYHFRGNAEGSTLRLTLGCLLGLELRRVGSGTRMTFGQAGEAELSGWMSEYARVCWFPCAEPWTVESAVIRGVDLPLNLSQNSAHVFHPRLTEARAQARARARALPVLR
ncbi:hypothetical protein SAMN05421504_101492 [Amycolatopsis xylanica]|uniref:GIY-YIG catalytic domain-containing protein n=1 Tax=Amycolatopsis xylanica TaxID=589385 RepID=A0A1H2T9D3_9PSEU|nr:hypothetical protein [Amycolatopsis xylanica]SDW40305.1 hypothetical protein SAMN05421504_101492 [Amycolatopsis xylanica]